MPNIQALLAVNGGFVLFRRLSVPQLGLLFDLPVA